MFCAHSSSYLITRIHEAILPLTPEINDISFNKLLLLKKEVSIHNKKMQTLQKEVYKN